MESTASGNDTPQDRTEPILRDGALLVSEAVSEFPPPLDQSLDDAKRILGKRNDFARPQPGRILQGILVDESSSMIPNDL